MPRGPKFDQIVQEVFAIQLNGRGKTPEERVKILRKLSGIKEAPEKERKRKEAGQSREARGDSGRKKGRRRGKTSHPDRHKAGMKAAAAKHKSKK